MASRLDPREEGGVVALMVLLSLFVVFGMIVLVVDLGALIVKHRGLVNANDSAALAAADSFGRNEGDTASTQADRFARENVPDAEHDTDWWTVTPGLDASGCDPSTCGSVRVRYQAGQALFFAPALGLSDHVTAHATATAIWGPAGGGEPAPIMVRLDWLEPCGIPNSQPVPECGLWLGDEEKDGGPVWAWINLDRWNAHPGDHCPKVQKPELRSWIAGRDLPQVSLNQLPPTFVCATSGNAGDFIDDLRDQIGNFKVMPVSDPSAQVGDKFDIVGFTVLKIESAIPGNEDGTPEQTLDCSWEPVRLEVGFPLNLKDDQPCPTTRLHYPGDRNKPFPSVLKGHTRFTGDVVGQCAELDYCYNPTTFELTWQRPEPVDDATVKWQYVTDPIPGKCPSHEFDGKAVCLVVSWQGYRTGGINPGTGMDFGLRAVRLSE